MAKNRELPTNYELLNIITPMGFDFKKTFLRAGDTYAKCLTVSLYLNRPDFGWLSAISQIEWVTASIEFHPTESGPMVDHCNDQIRQYRKDLLDIKLESERQLKEKAIEDLSNMIQRLSINHEVLGYVNIILCVMAPTEDILDERVKKVNSIITSLGGTTRCLASLQKDAYLTVSPYGVPNEKLTNIGYRNMPLSTFLGGFANADNSINDGTGILLGKSGKGKPVILDMWKRGGDRTNSNWFISGVPGVGKSSFLKFLFMLEYALGTKIIIVDPEKEFVELTKNLGGKVINCCGGIGGRINPLQVRVAPRVIKDEDDSDDEFYKDEGKGVSDLALHIQTLRTFHKLYIKNISDLELAKLEEILEGTYRRFDITWDTDISKLSNKDYPIYSDLYEDIMKELKEDKDNPILLNLSSYFRSIAIGADSYIFNGHTDIELDSDFIDFDISELLNADKNVLNAQSHNINSWIFNEITKNREEKILYGLDEGYLHVDPEYPEIMSFIKNVSKRIRKYEGGLIFITHGVVDVLDPAVKRFGQAIIDNACYKFIMGTDGKNLEETKDLFTLSEAEVTALASKQRGKGLLFAGSKRVLSHIEIPRAMLDLMGRAGGR